MTSRMKVSLVATLCAFALLATGCGSDESSDDNGSQSQPPPTGTTIADVTGDGAFVPSFDEVKQDKGPVFSEGCLIHGDEPESGLCEYGDVGSEKKVVIFGDSHALQWTPALIKVAKDRGWSLTALLHADCTAAQVGVNPNCDRWRENSLARIREERPGLVIVASNTGPNLKVQSEGATLDREQSEPLLESGMARTLGDFKAEGAAVTLMQDMAMSKDYLPSECVAENQNDPDRCTFRMDRPAEFAYDLKAAEQVGGIQVIDPLQKICPEYTCSPVHGNVLKFRDRFHITATYSELLAPWLEAELQNPW